MHAADHARINANPLKILGLRKARFVLHMHMEPCTSTHARSSTPCKLTKQACTTHKRMHHAMSCMPTRQPKRPAAQPSNRQDDASLSMHMPPSIHAHASFFSLCQTPCIHSCHTTQATMHVNCSLTASMHDGCPTFMPRAMHAGMHVCTMRTHRHHAWMPHAHRHRQLTGHAAHHLQRGRIRTSRQAKQAQTRCHIFGDASAPHQRQGAVLHASMVWGRAEGGMAYKVGST